MKYEYGGTEYEGTDFYCYPNTKVLMNRFDIREQDKLSSVEREITFAKTFYMQANPFKGALDLKYLQKIHKFIFEDVYTWAGLLRGGGGFMYKGDAMFCRADLIITYADSVFGKLRNEKWLRGLDRAAFIERLAYFMGEVNALHPFREGNGRTQRAFFQELTHRAKYDLDFGKVDGSELLQADIDAYNKDFVPLISLLNTMVTKL
ncbi:MAG: Fic family protein [Oscillospiraceae bacterium]|nr:Fic family protein [Oscillospiraceae bacterium]